MGSDSDWYQSEESLLSTLRAGPRLVRRAPRIAGYDNFVELRRGGQGVVYTAIQASTQRKVAIKVLSGGGFSSLRVRRRFEREIELIAALRHPGIVRLYDCGETADQHAYYVMEYIEGAGLDELMRPGEPAASAPLGGVQAVIGVFAALAEAVGFAHRNGVIHRDLKPSNVRMDRDGAPHVLDFGLARLVGAAAEADAGELAVTLTGEFMGSLPWSSPEHTLGAPGRVDVRSDVYSIGVMLYQALTGRFPYAVDGPFRDVLETIAQRDATSIRQVRRDLDDEVATIVHTCLEKDPERRYQSADALARDLHNYLAGEPITAKRDSAWYTVKRRLRRYRMATVVASVLCVIAVIGASIIAMLWRQTNAARIEADDARQAESAARVDAEHQAEIASQVNALLREMLASPEAHGRDARVVDTLATVAAQLETEEPAAPEVEVAVRDALGRAYATLGLLEEAEPLLVQSEADAVRLFGAEDRRALDIRANVAWLRYLQGRFDEAVEGYTQVLEAQRRSLPPDDSRIDVSMNDLAMAIAGVGRWSEAESLYRESLARMRARGAGESGSAISTLGNLAGVIQAQGRPAECEALAREQVALAERVLGPMHRDTLTSINNLATMLLERGAAAEAIAPLETVCARREQLLGPEHVETLRARQNLAMAYADGGDFERGMQMLREALLTANAALTPLHPLSISILSNLGTLEFDRGRFAEAEEITRKVIAAREQQLGVDHPDTLEARNDYANCQIVQLKYADAADSLQDLVERKERVFGTAHPSTLQARLNLADAWRESGRAAEARELAASVHAARLEQLGPNDPGVFVAEFSVAMAETDSGALETALEHLRALRRRAVEIFGAEHWYPPIVDGYFGKCLFLAGRAAEAEPVLLNAYDKLEPVFGHEHYVVQAQIGRLYALYQSTDQTDQAREVLDRLTERQRAVQAHERAKYAALNLPPPPSRDP